MRPVGHDLDIDQCPLDVNEVPDTVVHLLHYLDNVLCPALSADNLDAVVGFCGTADSGRDFWHLWAFPKRNAHPELRLRRLRLGADNLFLRRRYREKLRESTPSPRRVRRQPVLPASTGRSLCPPIGGAATPRVRR
jgi:hypothetical protein